MGASCEFKPYIKNKVSSLYESLLEYTHHNRTLTNFLYGLANSETIKSQFDKKDFNSQGELDFRAFKSKIDINSLISTEAQLSEAQAELDIYDENGDINYYESPNDLVQQVIDFNNTNKTLRANVKYEVNKGYHIVIEQLSASNFRNNQVIERSRISINTAIAYLDSLDFNTDFYGYIKDSFATYYNYKQFENALIGLQEMKTLTKNRAALALQLLSKNPLISRLKAVYTNTPELADRSLEEDLVAVFNGELTGVSKYVSDMLVMANNTFKREFHKININELRNKIGAAKEAFNFGTEEFLGTDSDVLNTTLKELYDKYHINVSAEINSDNELNTLEALANRLVEIKRAEKKVHDAKVGHSFSELDKVLNALSKALGSENYANVITDCLGTVQVLIKSIQDELKPSADFLESESTEADKLNRITSLILESRKLIAAYTPVLEALKNVHLLNIDKNSIDAEFLNQVKKTAVSIIDEFSEMTIQCDDLELNTIISFFKTHGWGSETVKYTSSGDRLDLKEIIQTMMHHPGFFSKMVYSLNECSDEGIAIVHNAIQYQARKRDEALQNLEFEVREMQAKLKGNTDFMFERNDDGSTTGNLVSYIDYKQYYKDKSEYKQKLIEEKHTKSEIKSLMHEWEKKHSTRESHVPFNGTNEVYNEYFEKYCEAIYGEQPKDSEGRKRVFTTVIPSKEYIDYDKFKSSMTPKQYEYYSKMIALKAALSVNTPDRLGLFEAVQITSDFVNQMHNIGNGVSFIDAIKEKIADQFMPREDDEGYNRVIGSNGYKEVIKDIDGSEYKVKPIYFSQRLKNPKMLSTDMSSAMLSFATSALHYYYMDQIEDGLLLVKHYYKNTRQAQVKTDDGSDAVDVFEDYKGKLKLSVVHTTGEGVQMLDDLFDRELYGRKKRDKTVSIFGVDVSLSKAGDYLVGLTSRSGLTFNLMGGIANSLVGKTQMWIESYAGEFFDIKDYACAQAEYIQYIPEYLNELATPGVKNSFLSLLGDKFNIEQDYMQSLKEKGFSQSTLGRMVNSANLFMLYGMGEHQLHYMGAFATMHAIKVKNKTTGQEMNLFDALRECYEENRKNSDTVNLKFYFDYDRYTMFSPKKEKGQIVRDENDKPIMEEVPFTKEQMDQVSKRIRYVNKSMHGAFEDIDRSVASKYLFHRFVMNFRQWMPGHYQRRFRGRHYDADLGDMREGYYVSTYHFLRDCVKDLVKLKPQFALTYNEMSDMEKYNLKRALGELQTLALLSISTLSMGEYKDKKGNWAARMLQYQAYRMLMETQASTPFVDILPMFFGKSPNITAFLDNIIKTLNSPMAVLSTIDDLASLIQLNDLFITIEGGKYDGENKYLHNLEKSIPYYGKAVQQIRIKDEDYIFQVFEK